MQIKAFLISLKEEVMTEFIENIFSTLFGNNVVLATILISAIPVIELKGSIPFAMSPQIWGSAALPYWTAFAYGLLGSCMVVPVLALIYIPIINWLKKTKLFKKLAEKIEAKVNKQKDKIEQDVAQKTQDEVVENIETKVEKTKKKKIVYDKKFFLRLLGVFGFVAIPLPLTGVWTGTCLAVALGLGFWWSCLSVILGNVVAGLIITLVSNLFGDATIIFFYILIGIILLAALFMFVKKVIKKYKSKKAEEISNNN